MSEVAGHGYPSRRPFLEKPQGGKGKLMGGVPGGTSCTRTYFFRGGIVGTNAAQMAAGMGAEVMITDVNLPRLRYLSEVLPKNSKKHSILHFITSKWNCLP